MASTNERVFILCAILFATFGCKGAGALQLAGAVAVTAVRVAAVSAAASHAAEESAPPPEPERVVIAMAPVPAGPSPCVELTPGVDAPPAARAVQCGPHLLVEDAPGGVWHEVPWRDAP